jgi:hypothetical protein
MVVRFIYRVWKNQHVYWIVLHNVWSIQSVCISGNNRDRHLYIVRMIDGVGRVVTLHIGRAVEALPYQLNGRKL